MEGCPIHTNRLQWNSTQSIGFALVKRISLRGLMIFPLASGWVGVHSTCRLVRLVPMEYHLFHRYCIGEMHRIMGTYNFSVGFRLGGGALYSSIGTIGTSETSFIPLAFHWWNTSHCGDFEYPCWLQAGWGCIIVVHWYDWYQWNNSFSIGKKTRPFVIV